METTSQKISQIEIIVNDYGSFTPNEIGSQCPVINAIGKHSVIVERINANDVDICEYVDGMEVNEATLSYEELSNDLIDEIYELVLLYQIDSDKAIKRTLN